MQHYSTYTVLTVPFQQHFSTTTISTPLVSHYHSASRHVAGHLINMMVSSQLGRTKPHQSEQQQLTQHYSPNTIQDTDMRHTHLINMVVGSQLGQKTPIQATATYAPLLDQLYARNRHVASPKTSPRGRNAFVLSPLFPGFKFLV